MRNNQRKRRLLTGLASLSFFIGASFCFGVALQGEELDGVFGIQINDDAASVLDYLPFFNAKAAGRAPYPNDQVENQVILVNLKEDGDPSPWLTTDKLNQASNLLNGEGESLKRYMADISAGQINVTSTLYDGGGDGYAPDHGKAYYLTATDGKDEETLEFELLQEIMNKFEQGAPLSEKTCESLDTNEDGYVDNMTFVIRGDKDDTHNLMWPHQYSINPKGDSSITYPSVSCRGGTKEVKDYNIILSGDGAEGSDGIFNTASGKSDLGVIVHEYLHVYGFPDMYHNYKYDAEQDSFVALKTEEQKGDPLGRWDVMDYTIGRKPQYPLYYTNMTYSPWKDYIAQPKVITKNESSVSLEKVSYASGGHADMAAILKVDKTVNGLAEKEYFMVEYRKQEGWDSELPQSGLIVYRINETANTHSSIPSINEYCSGSNNGKATYCGNMFGPQTADEVFVFRPNATEVNPGIAGTNSDANLDYAALSSSLGKATLGKPLTEVEDFNEATLAETIYYSDGSNSGIVISNVSATDGDQITFDVSIPESTEDTASPVIDPAISGLGIEGRWTNKAPKLSVHISDQESGIAQIEVTTKDGALPEGENNVYTKTYSASDKIKETTFTFTAGQKGTYEIAVRDQAGNVSKHEVAVTHMDTTLPEINMDQRATVTETQKEMTVSFVDHESGIKPNSAYYATLNIKDETKNINYQNPITDGKIRVPADFQGKVCVIVEDVAGNESKQPSCWVISDDELEPTVQVNAKGEATAWTKENRTIEVQSSDVQEKDTGISYIEVTTTNGAIVSANELQLVKDYKDQGQASETYTFEVKRNGEYQVKVCDYANHCTTKSVTIENIDQNAPVIDTIHVKNATTYAVFATSAHTISFDAHDEPMSANSGLKEIKYQLVKEGESVDRDLSSAKWISVEADEVVGSEEGFVGMVYAYAIDHVGNASTIYQKEIERISTDLPMNAKGISDSTGTVSLIGLHDSDVSMTLLDVDLAQIEERLGSDYLSSRILHNVYDISLLKNGSAYALNEIVTVRLNIDQELQGNGSLQVIAISEDGTVTKLDSIVGDGYVEFETEKLQLFATITDKTIDNTKQAPEVVTESGPQTGDATVLGLYSFGILFSIVGISLFVRYHRMMKHNDENNLTF